jgi:hypothetical protein
MGFSFDLIKAELADNWPAFTYILLVVAFSVLFFRQQRTEAQRLQERLDKLESVIQQSLAKGSS